ncbi:TniQ family protein [Idiomarina abyssalis]|uniref:TniQ family protein n=1 Tax=Idiomarina abyssalis TaxID=86102 RepID=UPI003A930F6E
MNDWPDGRWPRFPRPREDELFSSWLARLAIANGAKASLIATQTDLALGSNYLRSIDYIANESLLDCIAHRVGLSSAALWKTTLSDYLVHLSVIDTKRNQNLLLLGLIGFKKERFFLQYCPLCLRDSPHFRRLWRISSIVTCPVHGVVLHDRCSSCGAPINVFGNDEKDKRLPYQGEICICWNCGFDLKESPAVETSENMVKFSARIADATESGHLLLSSSEWCYLGAFLLGIRQLTHALLKAQSTRYPGVMYDIDMLPLDIRFRLIEEVVDALSNLPDSFLRICQRWGITPYRLKTLERTSGPLPYWLSSKVSLCLVPRVVATNQAEVAHAIQVMRSRKLKVNPYSVSRFMGLYKSDVVDKYFAENLVNKVNVEQ